jgi:hypothetical protein
VVYLLRSKITLAALREFYQQLEHTFPQAETIYVVQGNWPIHYHPDVLAILRTQDFLWPLPQPANWPDHPRPNIPALNLPIQLVFLLACLLADYAIYFL